MAYVSSRDYVVTQLLWPLNKVILSVLVELPVRTQVRIYNHIHCLLLSGLGFKFVNFMIRLGNHCTMMTYDDAWESELWVIILFKLIRCVNIEYWYVFITCIGLEGVNERL